MKYYIFILSHRSDSSGFQQSWHLIKPHESIGAYESLPPGMALTYEGFDSAQEAENWIKEYGERNFEYTILPITKRK